MEKKHQVHNLIILDESGSMISIKETIIRGFNELNDKSYNPDTYTPMFDAMGSGIHKFKHL